MCIYLSVFDEKKNECKLFPESVFRLNSIFSMFVQPKYGIWWAFKKKKSMMTCRSEIYTPPGLLAKAHVNSEARYLRYELPYHENYQNYYRIRHHLWPTLKLKLNKLTDIVLYLFLYAKCVLFALLIHLILSSSLEDVPNACINTFIWLIDEAYFLVIKFHLLVRGLWNDYDSNC
jgi:hypothetical protein